MPNSSVRELLHRVMGMFDADSNALIDIGPHAMQAFVVYSETQLLHIASNSVMGKCAKLARLWEFGLLIHVVQAASEP